jgi:hypothetical protein
MLTADFVQELRTAWLPNVNDAGLDRIVDLLRQGSPLLVHGRFTAALPQGCLATHVAWHHPAVGHRTHDAGILWLSRVAGLNPATSHVIQAWDRYGPRDWGFRSELLALLEEEQAARRSRTAPAGRKVCCPAGH